MNSKETLTCNLFQLPQDIFRVIFQYLSVEDLMKGEEAFLNNQELLSLYRSSLDGFTLKETIVNQNYDEDEKLDEELISWIIDNKLLVETLILRHMRYRVTNLLNQIRSSLKTIHFSSISSDSDHSVPDGTQLGHFPSLTSANFFKSNYFTNETLISFVSQNPQLEIVKIHQMSQLSNEIIPPLSNNCPKIKILSLLTNDWVTDETISLLTEQRLFPNLKSLEFCRTDVRNQESLRQFILSHPLLASLDMPNYIDYSDDFLLFYLRQLIFPSILSQNNDNDLGSHSSAISSLCYLVGGIVDGRFDVVNPEIFSVDILSHLYYKDCPHEILRYSVEVFSHLSKFPSMIDSILQSQFIPFILDYTRPDDFLPTYYFVNLLFGCGVFHDYLPLVVDKCRTHPSSLIKIFHQAVQDYFSLLTTEELQTMIPIVLNELHAKDYHCKCLQMISKLLQEPSSQLLLDPNTLLSSLQSIEFSYYNTCSVIDCLKRFISVNGNYQQLLHESNLIPQFMTLVTPDTFVDFVKHCLLSSQDELLVDHLVDSGLFKCLLSKYSQGSLMAEIEAIFKRLIEFKNNKYSEMVREMKLPNELRVKLF